MRKLIPSLLIAATATCLLANAAHARQATRQEEKQPAQPPPPFENVHAYCIGINN